MTVMFLFILSVGGLALYAVHVCLVAFCKSENPETKSPGKKRQLDLERMACIWTKRTAGEEPLAESEKEEKPEKNPGAGALDLDDPALKVFHAKYILDKSVFPPQARKIAESILGILDREGGCPSVVNAHGEAESSLEGGAYERLARVILREHAVDTVEEMLRLIEPGPMTPMAIIAALGHDLGKIPEYRKKLYALGDHPVISVTILEKLPCFAELSNREDIVRAIRDHHRKPVDFFSIKLKEADQEARKKELARSFSLNEEKTNKRSNIPGGEERRETTGIMQIKSPYHVDENDRGDKKKKRPREIDLPWYDGEMILREIAERINVVDGGRWEAFSMSNGCVYAQVGLLWSVAKTVARKNGDSSVLIGDADEDLRVNILYSIVQRLKTEQKAIARGLIRDGYFCAPFVVTMRDGTIHPKAMYVPFNLEAFGTLTSEMETKKYGKVQEIVDVTPKWE